MLALVKVQKGPGNMSLLEVPEPEPGPGEVKIRVEAAGICGTDLHFWHGDGNQSMLMPPVTLGHEFSGIIESVGLNVSHWKAGDYVTSEPPFYTCQECEYCRRGIPALCAHRRSLGSGVNGAFTRYVVAPEHRLHRIPDHLDFVSSALSEPTAVCVHATSEQSHITAGDIILVTGPGTIGLLISQIAKAHGAYVILIGAVDDRNRLELGLSLGVDKTLMAGQDNIDLVIQEITRGKGADVAYECSGNQAAANLCLSNLKKRGLYTQVGVFNQAIQLDFNLLVTKEINAIGSFGSTSTDWERAHILLANGVVRCKPLVTCDLPLTQWEEAFLLLERKEACKAILRPL